MGVKHLVTAFELEGGFDSSNRRHIYLEMAYWADRKGIIRLTQTEIAMRCWLSLRSVAREIKALADGGFIKRLEHGRYALRFPEPTNPEIPSAGAKTAIEAELERLKAIKKPREFITFTGQGWPSLQS